MIARLFDYILTFLVRWIVFCLVLSVGSAELMLYVLFFFYCKDGNNELTVWSERLRKITGQLWSDLMKSDK